MKLRNLCINLSVVGAVAFMGCGSRSFEEIQSEQEGERTVKFRNSVIANCVENGCACPLKCADKAVSNRTDYTAIMKEAANGNQNKLYGVEEFATALAWDVYKKTPCCNTASVDK